MLNHGDDIRPLVLNKNMNDEGKFTFTYSYRDSNASPDFLTDLTVNWETFQNKVLQLNNLNPVDLDRLALKFIHRYNETTNRWFLTVQLCEIYGKPLPDADFMRRHESYLLICRDLYFTINDNGTISEDGSNGLGGSTESRYGVDYFNNVYYGVNRVVLGRNVQCATYSWYVIQKVYSDNQSAERPDNSLFSLCFTSSSYKALLPSKNTYVEYPHCITLFMQYNSTNCLDGNDVVLGNFGNKAANYNSLCPKRCGLFLWNADLPRPLNQTF
jgi:hypothetical protein